MSYSAWVFEIDDTSFDGINVNTLNYTRRGPYIWDETRERVDIEFESNENVSFTQQKTFKFNAKKSCQICHADDLIHVYNPLHVNY